MCCSGNHNHNKNINHEDNKNKSQFGKFHFPMMLCCLIPIIALLFWGSSGVGGNINKIFPFLMIALCLGLHFLMKGHSHSEDKDCCNTNEQKSQNSNKADM